MPHQDAASPDGGGERLVAGRYRLLSVLGAGGMGTVWRAFDEVLRREAAVKEVRAAADLPADRGARLSARLEREAWAAARVNARGVVSVYDVVTFDGRPWIVMELVRGRSLADVIGSGGALPPKEAARIGVEVLAALRAAHGAGVLHRDVKPANVLLADEGRVVLTDFGIATVEGDTPLTMTGEVVGSPEYVAPERALGRTPGAASDLWSLGALLYMAVQGRSPFRRTTALDTLRAIVDDELPPPHRAGPLTPVIEGLLRKDPGQRMTAEEAGRELSLIAGESPVPARADTATGTTAATTDPGTAAVTVTVTSAPDAVTVTDTPGATDAVTDMVTVGVIAAPETGPAPVAVPAPLGVFGPPPDAAAFGPSGTAPDPRPDPGAGPAPTPGRRHPRRTAYLMGAAAAVLVLLGGGLTYALVGRDGEEGTGTGGSASRPVSVTVTGGATTYDGSCPPTEDRAPWFTATFTTSQRPVQFSYRWVSENGAVTDRAWRTLAFREGDATTKKETVRLTTYAREGTLRGGMAVEIRSPFDAKSNSVAFSLTCRSNSE
ncbi:serine/threonine-protein kinase [Streptomyces griseiscabiei]|uniref:non-specific serine/threonine protein kinase n=2 Tax=Streptomyces griseiscabiei TaxID=2993540 RepID=A0ABU4LC11_9ACTN|nr:serine/threonine-protein kinase [Streptomyces griseiscabiei]MBZ3900300.1 serine/threonine protein kinase [Streptomyces griseiscabiei]MDX2913311.1 protein kinase [Streptomyces griseiscabiei]